MNLPKAFENRVRHLEPLSSHTTFQLGGKAEYWYEPRNKEELMRFLQSARCSSSVFVIGSGSNLLIKDGIIRKIFIHLKSKEFRGIRISGTTVTVGAGVPIGQLISVLSAKNLSGYEFLAGIPGTVGGALVMNAGAQGDPGESRSYREMKDIVEAAEVLDREGQLLNFQKKDLRFAYRSSNLRPYVVLSVRVKLKRANPKQAQRRIRAILNHRIKTQDWRYPSAGSFFKNPAKTKSAGWLIDRCRLKNFKVGGAQVSPRHANFIINVGRATSADVLKLMDIVRKKVYNHFKIKLENEVEIVS